jgi:hypothetical protein
MTFRIKPEARIDQSDLADWFEARRPGLGSQVAAALTDLYRTLTAQPRLYGRVNRAPRGREIRVGMPKRFSILVHYEVTATEVVILSVVHARSIRRPWRRRI